MPRLPQPQQPRPAGTVVVQHSSRTRVPHHWHPDIQSILIPTTTLKLRVKSLAQSLQHHYEDKNPVLISVLNGTVVFTADLIRSLNFPLTLDFIGTSSYRNQTRPGPLHFTKKLSTNIQNRHVLLIDDILDTGQTLHAILTQLHTLKPRSLRTCVLLQKRVPRTHAIRPHYTGFNIPNAFVVGYGLDYAEQYRNLPFIGVLRTPPP